MTVNSAVLPFKTLHTVYWNLNRITAVCRPVSERDRQTRWSGVGLGGLERERETERDTERDGSMGLGHRVPAVLV